MLQALKADLQQSTPLLQGETWVSQSEVKTPWPPNQHWNWVQRSQRFLLLFFHCRA